MRRRPERKPMRRTKMPLRRVRDYRGGSCWRAGGAMTQMHQILDRRPWEEKVEKPI